MKKINYKNIKAYLQGKIRYFLFSSKYTQWLISVHIFEQFIFRIHSANPECNSQGQCVKCGCETPTLYLSNSSCEGNCYPVFLSSIGWGHYKIDNNIEYIYLGEPKERNFYIINTKTDEILFRTS